MCEDNLILIFRLASFIRGNPEELLLVLKPGHFDFVFSRVMPHIPLSMDMSLLINFLTNRFVFGVNFTLDPSGLRRGE